MSAAVKPLVDRVLTITRVFDAPRAPFWSDEERDGHRGGWGTTFDRLG
jgi:hypothetical protein